jgi:hypothetical protein
MDKSLKEQLNEAVHSSVALRERTEKLTSMALHGSSCDRPPEKMPEEGLPALVQVIKSELEAAHQAIQELEFGLGTVPKGAPPQLRREI